MRASLAGSNDLLMVATSELLGTPGGSLLAEGVIGPHRRISG
jgi:hypothetical protein